MDKGLNRVMEGYYDAIDASNYEESLVLDVSLNSDTDYTLVWSNNYDGLYPLDKHKVEV